jgi:hypothetical protein
MNTEDFDKLLVGYATIKDKYVDSRLKFYRDRVDNKRRLAQWGRVAILLLSLAIPVVVTFSPAEIGPVQKELIVSLMSLLIALAGGLEGMHQWQRTWREYSTRIVQIETRIGLWEIQVARARQLSDAKEVSDILGEATEKLLSSVNEAVTTEMGTFFSEREKAQQTSTQT